MGMARARSASSRGQRWIASNGSDPCCADCGSVRPSSCCDVYPHVDRPEHRFLIPMAIDIYNPPAQPEQGGALAQLEPAEGVAAPAINEGARDHQFLIEAIDHPNLAQELDDDE